MHGTTAMARVPPVQFICHLVIIKAIPSKLGSGACLDHGPGRGVITCASKRVLV